MRAWDRLLWGVELRSPRSEPLLLGAGWDGVYRTRESYPGESTRALTFQTRKAALAWCRAKRANYSTHPVGDVCKAWRFVPVRVRETVQIVERPR